MHFSGTQHRRGIASAAFTLVEVLVSLAVIGISVGSVYYGLMQANQSATVGRLYTGAVTAAQGQIDYLLSDGPFNPASNQVPSELAVGTVVANNVPIYADAPPNAAGVYPGACVLGTMTTTVADTGITYNGNNMRTYRIGVQVNFVFKGKTYTVTMASLRASDT